MKKIKIKILLLLVISASSSSFAQSINTGVVFSVSPGAQLNGAALGYKLNKYVPYLGFQMLGINGTYSEAGKKNDFNTGGIVSYNDKYSVKLNVMLPTIGVRYFFVQKEKLKVYGNINFSRVFLSAKLEDSNDPTVNADFQEAIKNIRIYTGQLGFGAEYFFDNQFSLGGEFGFRYLKLHDHSESNRELFDPNTGNTIQTVNTATTSLAITPTYSKISLNFYFGK